MMDDEFYDSFDSTEESEPDPDFTEDTTEGSHEAYFQPVKGPTISEPVRVHSLSTPVDPMHLM